VLFFFVVLPYSPPGNPPFIWRMLLPFLKRFGKAAIAVEVSAVAGIYYVFHDINTGGPVAREKWDGRAPWIIDVFHSVTGDDRVISHRRQQQQKPTQPE
jgi:hypothetical protein